MTFDLRTALPMADILPYIDEIALGEEAGNDDWIQVFNNVIQPAIKELLKSKALNGELSKIPNGENHCIRFLTAWNNVCDGVFCTETDTYWTDRYLTTVAEEIDGMRGLLRDVSFMKYHKDTSHTRETAYDVLIAAIEKGRFISEGADCQVDGKRYEFHSENWNPIGKVRELNHQTGKYDRIDMSPLTFEEAAGVEHLEVAFESGELLVADAFRIEGFYNWVDEKFPDYYTINTIQGRVDHTKALWEKAGIVEISTANTSVYVTEEDGSLVVSTADHDFPEEIWNKTNSRLSKESIAHIDCDRRCVCIIDKKRMLENLADMTGSIEEAESLLQEYLTSAYTASQVSVNPGTYHLYFGRDHIFGLALSEHCFEGLDTEKRHTYCLLSDRERNYHHKDEPAPAALPPQGF